MDKDSNRASSKSWEGKWAKKKKKVGERRGRKGKNKKSPGLPPDDRLVTYEPRVCIQEGAGQTFKRQRVK